ncbi:2-isopropylmalate synthase [Desulfovibrio sp. OttesenSCG-928-I05]|nr:2-isopropylmalate synthase [Desulfovibrio sp. OttesenSCG-928-I05]
MSDRVIIFDTTLRDGEQSPGSTMSLEEKIRLARRLELLGVDVIEAGYPASSPGDFKAVETIAGMCEHAEVAGLARAFVPDIDAAWNALKGAKKPRIHIFVATSPLHMEFKLRKTPAEVLDQIRMAVSHAVRYTPNVEFSCEDASRSEPDFLVKACNEAILAGARTINLPDTVGYAQPEDFSALVAHVINNTVKAPDGQEVIFSVHCHNDLGMAVANTLAAVKAGARQVEATVGGIGERAGNAALEEVVMALHVRKDYYGLETGVTTQQIYPTVRLLSRIVAQPIPLNKPIVGANAFAHESGIHQDGVLKHRGTYEIMDPDSIGVPANTLIMGKHSGRRALTSKIQALGYKLNDEQIDMVFAAMKKLADVKKNIFDEDIEALILEEVLRIPDKYELVHLGIHSSDIGVPPTAMIVMTVDGEEKQKSAFGVGPIDAVFNAIAKITNHPYTLDRYSVNAITGGSDAQGEVTVRLVQNGRKAVGRGSHPDVINASARAFINALNRLAKRHEEH